MSINRTSLDRVSVLLGLLVVLGANFLYLAGLTEILDPMMSMEPFYIDMALLPVSGILNTDPSWGPLYALWLKPFRAVFADPLAVYRANVQALSLGVSSLIYLYALSLTRRTAIAVGAALFFLISDLNVPLASKVCGFALLIVLAALTTAELAPAGARRTTVVAAGLLLASYARPELYPAALCVWLGAAWLAFRELGESGWRVLLWPVTGAALVVLLLLRPGAPILDSDPGHGRFLAAFREHFALNWTLWNNQGGYFSAIWSSELGDAQTVLEAFRNNPPAIAHHLIDNLLATMEFMVGSAFNHYPLLVPTTWPALVKAESLLASAAVFGALAFALGRADPRRQMLDRCRHLLLPFAATAAFSMGAATVIFPKAHYLVIPAVLLLLAGALAAATIIPVWPVSSPLARAAAALACLAAVPRPFVLPSAYVVAGSPFKGRVTVTRTIVDTIERIRALRLPSPVQVLTLTDGIGEMLGPGFREIKIWRKGAQSLEQYIRGNDIHVIVTTEPGRDSFVVDDPYWELIEINPEAAGFTRLSAPDHEHVRVYVRTALLADPAVAAQP